jgi:hypothetical protein
VRVLECSGPRTLVESVSTARRQFDCEAGRCRGYLDRRGVLRAERPASWCYRGRSRPRSSARQAHRHCESQAEMNARHVRDEAGSLRQIGRFCVTSLRESADHTTAGGKPASYSWNRGRTRYLISEARGNRHARVGSADRGKLSRQARQEDAGRVIAVPGALPGTAIAEYPRVRECTRTLG